jgi:hypothetical protein
MHIPAIFFRLLKRYDHGEYSSRCSFVGEDILDDGLPDEDIKVIHVESLNPCN